jgi:hypothetical protein
MGKMKRIHLGNQSTKKDPTRRIQSRSNRSMVEQHKCNAVNHER